LLVALLPLWVLPVLWPDLRPHLGYGSFHQKILFHLPVPYSVDKNMGDLFLNKGDRKPTKGSVCQLLQGCGELVQRHVAHLHPVGRR
jgi:hypothetical protein